MCFQVTNETDQPVKVVYSQWVTREVIAEEGAMSELVLPSGLSAVVATPNKTVSEETRHRLTLPASETLTIRYAASVESQDGLTVAQIRDYQEPEADGPI